MYLQLIRLFAVILLFVCAGINQLWMSNVTAQMIQKPAGTTPDRKAEANRLFQEADQQLARRNYPAAIEKLQQAIVIYKQLGDLAGEGDALHGFGKIYYNQLQYKKALQFYQQALVARRKTGNRKLEAITLNDMGLAYQNLSQYAEALKYHQQALPIRRETGDRVGEGTTLHNMGLVYESLSQYVKALESFQQALPIFRTIGHRVGEGATLNGIGTVYQSLGQYPKALEVFQQALPIHRESEDREREGIILSNIGSTYDNLGQYPKALEVFQQALLIFKTIGDRAGEGKTLHNIGSVYNRLGRYPKALEYYQQALFILRPIGYRIGEEKTLNGMGVVYDNLGQYSKALEYYQQALSISKEIGDREGEGTTLNNMGLIYQSLGQYPKALEYYQQALPIRREIGDRFGEGTTLNNMGGVYQSLGQYPKALEYYQQALSISKEIGDREGEGKTLNNIGVTHLKARHFAEAEEVLRGGVTIRESLRPGLVDQDKVSIFEQQTDTYQFLQEALVAQNKNNAALEIAEQGRARAFVELLASKLNVQAASQIRTDPPNISEIQQIANAQNATLVEYSITDSDLLIWVIKPTGEITLRTTKLSALKTSLPNLVRQSRIAIGAGGRGIIGVKPSERVSQIKSLRQLHQILIQPIAELLPADPTARVVFLPQRSLFLVPFAALQDANGQYLIEKHTILTAPSIQTLALTRQQRQRLKGDNRSFLIVGNPTMPDLSAISGKSLPSLSDLPNAKTEALQIAQLFNTQAITGSDATKIDVVERMKQARIVHLATHGLLDDFKGLGTPGAIALAPSGQDNGLLTADEILDLKLQAELVVLSACDTGRGTITGDGVIGLSRSLITAGVPSVIVSLWSVPDSSTAALMVEFYRQLQRQPDKAKALRQAMLTTMKRHPEPVNWAAFTLIGEAQSR
jgi:CHAT domain-containing protein/Flp pilus assembly protein TadD